MRSIDTEVRINAPCNRVWSILTDFARYPDWNPFITRISGRPEVGSRLAIRIEPPGQRPMMFRPRVLAASPRRELRWLGRLLIPRLFDGEHSFELLDDADGCLLRQSEKFTGLLVPRMPRKMFEATEQGFVAMNEALKKRAERMTENIAGSGET
ncbi:MAG: SRPBCC family protein [Aestuariivirgaceae bacterium]